VTDPALRLQGVPFLQWPELRRLLALLPEARIVGGAVRDAVLGRPVADVDLATPRQPDETTSVLTNAGIRVVPTGIAHGTVTAVMPPRHFEITTLRRDVATDGRHAVVAFTDDWREDAARRDFTINALSMNAAGEVFDYFGGVFDLRAGCVRFVGDPGRRIEEDYLRVLRFFRFHASYGRGAPEPAAAAAIRAAVPQLGRLSGERVWTELRLVLTGPAPLPALGPMAELGVLEALVGAADPAALARILEAGAPADPVLRLAALLPAAAEIAAVADRLRLSNDERERLAALRAAPAPQPGDDDDALRRQLADAEPEILIGRTWLAGDMAPGWAALRRRLEAMPRPVFPLAGSDVLAEGVMPGPRVGHLLRRVRAWWLDRGCRPNAAACRAELHRLIAADAPVTPAVSQAPR